MTNDGVTREATIISSAVFSENPVPINTQVEISVSVVEATFTNLFYTGEVYAGEV